MRDFRVTLTQDGESRDQGLPAAEVAKLYVEHGDELRRFVLGVVHDRELAGDILQATFIKAVQRGHETRPESRKAWLFRVALNEALVHRRKQQSFTKAQAGLAMRDPKTSESPEDSVVRGEVVEQVREALNTLPAEQRQIVFLRIYEDKTFATIASELEVPLGTVLTRMRLALQKLKLRLDGED